MGGVRRRPRRPVRLDKLPDHPSDPPVLQALPLTLTPLPALDGEPPLLSILLGEPSDDCPVCRAHPKGGEITREVMMKCPCPLCTEARARIQRLEEDRYD